MRKQTVFVLAGITAVMLGFIVVYEQHTLSSGELESRRGQVLERFVRPRVHGIRIERGDEVLVDLVRDREAQETLDTFDVGTWHLRAPVTGAADPNAVDSVILACESLSARRTLDGVSAEDRTRFGLDSPRLVLTVEVADETQVVRIGADDEQLGATYVEVVGTQRVYIVGRDFFEALDQPTDHFRSKDLFEDLAIRDVTAMTLRYAHEGGEPTEAALSLRDNRWTATAPFEGWARRSTVLAIIDSMIDGRIARYVHEGGDSLVSEPRVRLTMTVKQRDAEGRDTGTQREQTVLVGRVCPASAAPDEETAGLDLLAVQVDDGPVVCVSANLLDGLLGSERTLRETRLLAASDDQIERFLFGTLEGSDSVQVRLEVRREGERWQVREDGGAAIAADDQAVTEYLSQLRGLEADTFERADAASLEARGLARPRVRMRIHHSDDETIEYLDVGAVDTVGVWVRRGDEPVLARYPLTAEALLEPSALRFRARTVLAREADDVLRVSITRDGVEERLSTDNGTWRIEAPAALAADRVASRDLVRALVSLRAVRWASEREEPAQGLSNPRMRVHLDLRERVAPSSDHDEHDHDEHEGEAASADAGVPLPSTIDLSIGANTEGGAFARLEGEQAVFVLSADVLDALARPLVDRELVSLDTSSATRITITTAAGSASIELRDGVWHAGTTVAAPDATSAFLERLRSLRARSVSPYGARPSFTAPAIVVEVANDAGTKRLEIGESTVGAQGGTAPARVSGIAAEFQIPAEVAAAIASYRP